MAVPLFQVDAFADRPFAGNPAAVCLLEAPADERWMQAVAGEMNLAETAFVVSLPPDGEGPLFNLRWFTPTVEVPLCGHATLASAHVLWESGRLGPERPARFETLSGRLTCGRTETRIAMSFPANRPKPAAAPDGLAEALGTRPLGAWDAGPFLLVKAADAGVVRGLTPDPARVAALPADGVIVTAAGDAAGIDFVSRMFAPRIGIAEDPVTGAAHCVLAPFWSDRLGREALTGYQASRRGGQVGVRVLGDRVELAGRAVTVLEGELLAEQAL